MTDVIYVPVKVKNLDFDSLMSLVDINEEYGIVTTVQFLDYVKEKENFVGQVLGCNVDKALSSNLGSFLFVGTGLFHPLNLAYQTRKTVYVLDVSQNKFFKLDESYLERYEKKKKGMLTKYIQSKKIGIIVSTKSGQNNMNRALRFKEKCEKEAYIFLCDEVKNLEDYNDIECWVNTACVRIFEDNFNVPLVNLKDVEEI